MGFRLPMPTKKWMPPMPMLRQPGSWRFLLAPQFFAFAKRSTPRGAGRGCMCWDFIDRIATLFSSAGFADAMVCLDSESAVLLAPSAVEWMTGDKAIKRKESQPRRFPCKDSAWLASPVTGGAMDQR